MSDSERRTVVDWARSYIEAKLHPVPIKRGSKKPDGGDGWNAKTYMPEDFEPDGNIGLMHDNQAALDFDFVHDQDGMKDVPDEDRYERSRELVELLLGEQAIISRSLKGLHAYFIADQAPMRTHRYPTLRMETRGVGEKGLPAQTLEEPSITDDYQRRWMNWKPGEPFLEVLPKVRPRALEFILGLADTILPSWLIGGRHDLTLSLKALAHDYGFYSTSDDATTPGDINSAGFLVLRILMVLGKDTGQGDTITQWDRADNRGYHKFPQDLFEKIKAVLRKFKMKKIGEDDGDGDKKKSAADRLIELGEEILTQVFVDEHGTPMVAVSDGEGGVLVMKTNSGKFKQYLTRAYDREYGKGVSNEALITAVNTFEARSLGGERIGLHLRFAHLNDLVYYDLGGGDHGRNDIVVIRPAVNGRPQWSIEKQKTPMFRREAHMLSQVTPVTDGDVRLILKHIGVEKEEQTMFLSDYEATIIDDIPRNIVVREAGKGTQKTMRNNLYRMSLDPSSIENLTMPKDHDQMIQQMAHHAIVNYDNSSWMNAEQSDTVCRAVTGAGASKRKLWTDEEDVILRVKRKVLINGVRNPMTRTDALDRIIDYDTRRVAKMSTEKKVLAAFEKDLPRILGGVFDDISRALALYPTVETEMDTEGVSLPRMADATIWGEALAQARGNPKGKFLRQYLKNRGQVNAAVLEDSLIARAIRHLVEKVLVAREGKVEWTGTMKDLLKTLREAAALINIDTKKESEGDHPRWPKGERALSATLNEVESNLLDDGIEIRRGKHGKQGVTLTITAHSEPRKPANGDGVTVVPVSYSICDPEQGDEMGEDVGEVTVKDSRGSSTSSLGHQPSPEPPARRAAERRGEGKREEDGINDEAPRRDKKQPSPSSPPLKEPVYNEDEGPKNANPRKQAALERLKADVVADAQNDGKVPIKTFGKADHEPSKVADGAYACSCTDTVLDELGLRSHGWVWYAEEQRFMKTLTMEDLRRRAADPPKPAGRK